MQNLISKMYKMIDERNVSNKQLIDGLFDVVGGYETSSADDSAFEDDVLKQEQAESFIKRYIDTVDDISEQNDMAIDFISANVALERLGFRIGFQTALKLILESGVKGEMNI